MVFKDAALSWVLMKGAAASLDSWALRNPVPVSGQGVWAFVLSRRRESRWRFWGSSPFVRLGFLLTIC